MGKKDKNKLTDMKNRCLNILNNIDNEFEKR